MKFYYVLIRYNEDDEDNEDAVRGAALCKLETEEEEQLYDEEEYTELLEGTGYSDEDIYFYLSPDSEEPYVGMEVGDATIIDI